MKIKYEFKKNKFKYYDIANGAMFMSEKLKKKNKKIFRFSFYVIKTCFLIVLFSYIIYFFLLSNDIIIDVDYFSSILSFVIVFSFMILILLIIGSNMIPESGMIEIEEKGIKNIQNDGYWEFLPYDAMEMVIVTKDLILIKRNKFQIILLPKENHLKIINEIKKYKNDLLVIRCDEK